MLHTQTSNFKLQTSNKLQVSNFKSLIFGFWCLNFERFEGVLDA